MINIIKLRLRNSDNSEQCSTCIYPTPPNKQDVTQGQFFMRSLTGLNSSFPSLSSAMFHK